MTIPEIRDRMHALANRIALLRLELDKMSTELHSLAEGTWRRHAIRRTRRKSRPISPRLIQAIRRFERLHRDLSEQEIAVIFEVSAGRVSEALHGKRT